MQEAHHNLNVFEELTSQLRYLVRRLEQRRGDPREQLESLRRQLKARKSACRALAKELRGRASLNAQMALRASNLLFAHALLAKQARVLLREDGRSPARVRFAAAPTALRGSGGRVLVRRSSAPLPNQVPEEEREREEEDGEEQEGEEEAAPRKAPTRRVQQLVCEEAVEAQAAFALRFEALWAAGASSCRPDTPARSQSAPQLLQRDLSPHAAAAREGRDAGGGSVWRALARCCACFSRDGQSGA